MKTFQEFITEGRDAPLYHATGLRTAKMILQEDVLRARKFHPGEYRHYMDPVSQDTKLNNTHEHLHDKYATSLTRSLQFALDWRLHGVVFEIDQRKLAQTHKLVPYNYFMKTARSSASKDAFLNQMEEVVIGDIKTFGYYVTKVILETKGQYDMVLAEKQYHVIANHPKLYLLYAKKFASEITPNDPPFPHMMRKATGFV